MGLINDLNSAGLTAAQVAYAAEAVGQLPIETGGRLEFATDGYGGSVAADNPVRSFVDVRTMVVVGDLPGGKDFKDARYFVSPEIPAAGGWADAISFVGDSGSVERFLVATNLAEHSAGSHLLQAGARVLVFHLYTAEWGDFYVFSCALAPTDCTIKITSGVGGSGTHAAAKYNAKIIGFPTADVSKTADATLAELGADGIDCIAVNLTEVGREHHAQILDNGTEWLARRIYANADGTVFVEFNGGPANNELFRVDVTKVAGADGNDTTPVLATWTYDLKVNGVTISAAAKSPEKPRLVPVTTTPATKGIAYYKVDGTLMLWDTDESYNWNKCS